MKQDKTLSKGGRPPKNIDEEMVEKLASIGCTVEEIASTLGCCRDTLHRRFSDTLKRGHNAAKISLRRMQWKSAAMGNVTMQIWLGKNMLSQSNKHEISLDEQVVQILHFGGKEPKTWLEEQVTRDRLKINHEA